MENSRPVPPSRRACPALRASSPHAAGHLSGRDEVLVDAAAAAEQPADDLADRVPAVAGGGEAERLVAARGGALAHVLGRVARHHVCERVVPREDVHHRAQDEGEDDEDGRRDEAVLPVVVVFVVLEQRRHRERDHRHELDQDVEGGARGVLERVADGVADDARLLLLLLGRVLALLEAELLAQLLRVVPRAARVGHHDGEHAARGDGAREQAHQEARPHQEAAHQRREDGVRPRRDHLADRRARRDGDALVAVGLDLVLRRGAVDALAKLLRLFGVYADALSERDALGVADVLELPADLGDDLGRRLAHADHRQRREQVRQHRAREDAREDDRVADVVARRVVDLVLEGGEEGERRQDGGADGEALARGGGRVAQRVERVGDVAHLLAQVGQLGEAARVVGDGAVRVGGEGDAEGGEHAHRRDGNAVRAAERRGRDDRHREHQRRRHARDHADAEALDDDGRGARHAAILDRHDWAEVEGGEVLGHLADRHARREADDDARKNVGAEAADLDDADVGAGGEEGGGEVHALLEGPHEGAEVDVPPLALRAGVDCEEADGGGDDADGGQEEGERDGLGALALQRVALLLRLGDGERRSGDDRADVRLKQVRAHARHVADVVADVVRDDGRVVRVVLVDPRLDLADQVRADVRRLGVDPSRHARKERNR
mmetsp:Transcript_25457/g.75625  ORF Transcript_25457/g.75625 Transcript_25457/m.75625 type:complete len:667 (+) Transcript_25457:447-2447(+)